MNTSLRCLFVLAAALTTTAPAYSQGYIVPNGVTYSSAGLRAVIHVMQSPTNGDYTGFILRPQFKTPGSPYYTVFSFDPAVPDEGVRVFFASQNDPISLQSIQAGAYTELGDGNYYGFDPGVPFFVGFYTGHINGAPPRAYSNAVFGWGEFVNHQGVIQMLDAALVAEGGGIYVGTQTIIPIPEPGILGLSTCGALILGWRSRRLNPTLNSTSSSRCPLIVGCKDSGLMRCSYCGMENEEDASSCRDCGCPLEAPPPKEPPPAPWTRVCTLESEVESKRLECELEARGIPHVITTYGDAAFDGIFQTTHGWGCVEAPVEKAEVVLEVLLGIRSHTTD